MTLLHTWQAGAQLMNSLSHRRLLLSVTGAPTEADWTRQSTRARAPWRPLPERRGRETRLSLASSR
jgi:hypothetical protein